MRRFINRTEAGKILVEELDSSAVNYDIVIALPRGGVPVGVEISKALGIPFNIFIVRKLGAPSNPEFGIGAIAERGIIIIDEKSYKKLGITENELKQVISAEEQEMKRRIEKYRQNKPFPDLKDKNVLLVDDGAATGITAKAAIQGIKEYSPKSITFASPVCSRSAASIITEDTDDVVCLLTPTSMQSVGAFYQDFDQVSDEEVLELLSFL